MDAIEKREPAEGFEERSGFGEVMMTKMFLVARF